MVEQKAAVLETCQMEIVWVFYGAVLLVYSISNLSIPFFFFSFFLFLGDGLILDKNYDSCEIQTTSLPAIEEI